MLVMAVVDSVPQSRSRSSPREEESLYSIHLLRTYSVDKWSVGSHGYE